MNQQAMVIDREIAKRVQLRYLLWLPDGYGQDVAQRWPLILFLHGRGERGNDVATVTRCGLPERLVHGFELPAIVVAPQCPAGSDWTLHDDALLALLDEIGANCAVDPTRVYLTGLSMGGREAWRLAAIAPARFAALVPICGRRPDNIRTAEDVVRLSAIPTWVFHGAKDQIVPITESEGLVADLRACGSAVRYTIYPDADHDSWTRAYGEPELYPWLFRQRRSV